MVLGLLLATLAFAAAPAMAEFGLERAVVSARNQDGTPDLQAGSHPYSLNTSFLLHEPGPAGGDLKDVRVELPPGFVGDPTATPRCSYQEFIKTHFANGARVSECSNETAVGLATSYLVNTKDPGEFLATTSPIYNIVPPPGVAAEFGYVALQESPVLLETSVRTGGDYGLTTSVSDLNQAVVVGASKVTIWGVPANSAHNPWRGTCERSYGGSQTPVEEPGYGLREGEDELEGPVYRSGEGRNHEGVEMGLPESNGEVCKTAVPEAPLLTNPTSCGTPRTATLSVDDWEEPGNFATGERVSKLLAPMPELSGCEGLDFTPTLEVKPDGEAGSTPTGLNVGLHVPQEGTSNPAGTAEADVKDTIVTLPAGVEISPSAADGLQACSNAQVGFLGSKELSPSSEPGVQTPQFRPKIYNEATKQEEATLCPDAAKIASVKLKTPLLEGELTGSVYLAAPQNFAGLPENPFGSLVAMYLVAEEPERGVEIKLPGYVELGEAGGSNGLQPGQIRTTYANTPQLPFSELKLEFYGTNRAPLATPAQCGTYETEASLQPWSGAPAVRSVADFNIDSGPNGGACPGSALPFSPSLASGVTNINAGSFSDLTTTLSREDGQQSIQSVTLHYPPGVSGILAGIPLCGDAQADAGTCGAASELGETIVSVGLGGDPFPVTGGKVYLTGPYNGTGSCTVGEAGCAPFGLSIVNPAKAGPFDLQEGRPVVVRAKIEVDPHTAALTVTTDGAGEHAIPTIIDGIPLQIKHVNVNITRQGFTFNPTSCDPTKITGAINSMEGASAPVEEPFQVTNCASLKFAPSVSFSTNGKASKQDGADLITKLTYPRAPQGTDANIGYVKVELPKALPSRLTTLQKACTDAQFEANPAGCPPESKVGYATVHTPLLPVPLTGPAIFVSHGNEAYPSLTMVLQGYGVTIDLVGATSISKAGITSTTFKTVPDVPFTTFELTLPEGPYSALTTNLPHESHDLCGQKLTMPTEFIGQDGATIKQSTAIAVTGCAPAITVVSHRVKGRTATIAVSVPAAGKLIAAAKGLSKASKTAKGATTLTLKLALTNAEAAFLGRHKARKLKAKINLTFTPKSGTKLKTSTTVIVG